nr:DUF2397 family protein [uncultured Marivita sp.]
MAFDAVSEDLPGAKWLARWYRSWPSYEAWFIARGGDAGPDAATCRAALGRHMPELLVTYDRLVAITGGSERAARFLSTWCPKMASKEARHHGSDRLWIENDL